jgi:hypothetical protein
MNTKENTLIENLNRIPHLELPFKFSADKIREEINGLPYPPLPYKPYNSIFEESGWNSLALFSTEDNIISNPQENWEGNFQPTGLRDFMPYTYETLDKFKGGKLLARIETINPKSTAGWHSHQLSAGQPDWLIVCQLPITMPKKSKYSQYPKQYDLHYKEGTVYVFNSYHYHNVFNHDDEPMVMIRFYLDLREESVYRTVKTAVENYTGELMITYDDYIKRDWSNFDNL